MNKIVDRFLTNLFGLAEKVANKFDHSSGAPTVKCDIPRDTPKPHIRFSNDDKVAIERVKCDTCISTIEREQARPKVNMVEGELFK